jgi:formylglycine-generating enzyme
MSTRGWPRSGLVAALLIGSFGATAAVADDEHEFWQSAERCGTQVCYQEYLKRYPQGTFAVIAGGAVRQRELDTAPPAAPSELAAGGSSPTTVAAQPAPQTAASRPSEPALVTIPGGCFEMGSPESEEGRFANERLHQVCVSAFQIGKYEVTQRQWREVMENEPSYFRTCNHCPVEQVSWNDVQDYVSRLNLQTGKHYRLPTEAEWEFACRGGRSGGLYCGAGDIDALAWYRNNSESRTHPVGEKQPNGLGLDDMSGNVWEWTCSAFVDGYDGAEARCVDRAWSGQVATRGGARYSESRYLRAAVRDGLKPTDRQDSLGFRLALDAPGSDVATTKVEKENDAARLARQVTVLAAPQLTETIFSQ